MKAILFDMDGVLLDSKEAWRHAFKEAGNITDEEFENEYWGRDLTKNLEEIDMAFQEEQFCSETFMKFLDKIKSIDGAKEALEQIAQPKALITNTTETCTRMILEHFGMLNFFDVIVTSDKVENGKPAPDMLLKACDELGHAPSECVIVGDSQEDIKAGNNAGCITIGIGTEGDYKIDHIKELPKILYLVEKPGVL